MKRTPPGLILSQIALIINNLVPVLGVIYLKWNLFNLILIFWLESGVVGILNLFKMFRIKGLEGLKEYGLFTVGYGSFMIVHYIFLMIGALLTGYLHHLDLRDGLFGPIWRNHSIIYALISMIISHSISFLFNFLGNQEYLATNIGEQMFKPFHRVLLIQATILGAAAIMIFFKYNEPVIALIIMTLIKTMIDLKAHRNEHPYQVIDNKVKMKSIN